MPLLVTSPQRAMLRQANPGMLPRRLASVLSQNHARVLDLFRVADKNLDGEITRPELAKLLRSLGIEFSQAELAHLFDTLDPDGSGGIDFRELQRALRNAASDTRLLRSKISSPSSRLFSRLFSSMWPFLSTTDTWS